MRVEELKDRVYEMKELPTLPVVAQQIMRATNEDENSFKTLSKIVEQDPSLTMQLLGLANTAIYGQQARVASASRAISVVGTATLKRLALCAFVKEGWKSDARREQFWRHSIAVAFGTAFLAGCSVVVSPDDAFSAGLLHDVGVLVLETVLPGDYPEVESRIAATVSRADAEQDLFDVDHTQAGAWFADRWQLPGTLIEGIDGHHSDTQGSMPWMIRIAEKAATAVDFGLYGELDEEPEEEVIEAEKYLRSKAPEIAFFTMAFRPAA